MIQRPYHMTLALLGILSAASMAFALGWQYIGNLQPCPLCTYQRIPFIIALVTTGSLFLFFSKNDRLGQHALVFLGICFLGNTLLAGYHTGIEHGWWVEPASCSIKNKFTSMEDIEAMLNATKAVSCKTVLWRFLGLSMTEYVAFLSLTLSALCFWSRKHT